MKYMLLIYAAEDAWTDSERLDCYKESTELAHTLKASGHFLGTSPLQSVATATTVRVRDGKRLVTDGPFAETREQLGGFFMVEAKNLDEAIEIAGRIPGARKGTVEIRPVVVIENLPVPLSDRRRGSTSHGRKERMCPVCLSTTVTLAITGTSATRGIVATVIHWIRRAGSRLGFVKIKAQERDYDLKRKRAESCRRFAGRMVEAAR